MTTHSDIPAIGTRYRLARPIERGGLFYVPAGATGAIVESSADLVSLRLDTHIPALDSWDNEVMWTDAYRDDFIDDAEPID